MNAPRLVLALLLLVVAACGVQTPVEPGAAALHESTTTESDSTDTAESDSTRVGITSPMLGGAN